MKLRTGFVTNSSSTNFLIVSKKELNEDYLLKKLGFSKNSKLGYLATELASTIMSGTERGPRYEGIDEIDYSTVLELFGREAAEKFKKLNAKGFHAYIGYTSSDDDCLSAHMTVDSFIIDDKDFYMHGEHCVW